jgi:large repetitive protein
VQRWARRPPAGGAAINNAKPSFAGVASTGEADSDTVRVKLYAGPATTGTPVLILTAPVGTTGAYTVAPTSALADGTYTAQAQISDADGLHGASTANTFTLDTVAPHLTLGAPPMCSSSAATRPTFSGKAGRAGGDQPAITVRLYKRIGTTGTPAQTLFTKARAGRWSVRPASALAGGTWTAQASQSDQAGNTGHSLSSTFNITTTTVLITAPAECSHTGQTAPTFKGRAGAATGDSRTITLRLYSGWRDTGTAIRILTATRTAGRWQVKTPAALRRGVYTAQATQQLSHGRSMSPAIRFTIGTPAPR